MRRIGLPEFSKDGFLLLGGGGFIDLPLKGLQWLRVGGSGEGFSAKRQITLTDNVVRTSYYKYRSGGITLDYVKIFGKRVEMTFGAHLSTGKLYVELYQTSPGFGNWTSILNEFIGAGLTENPSRNLSVRFYSARPQIGLGVFVTPYLYAKLNAGYQFSANSDWEVDNGVPVTNAPAGIKAEGFLINFGLNFGLFTK